MFKAKTTRERGGLKKFKTDETATGVIRIVNGALEEVLVNTADIVVGLDLAGHVVTV